MLINIKALTGMNYYPIWGNKAGCSHQITSGNKDYLSLSLTYSLSR